jgi:hypothetical protein
MPRFQFSLRWLLITVTVAAVLLFLAVTFGDLIEVVFGDLIEVVFFSVVWCILPTPLVVFVIFDRGDLQAFAIGALVPWVVMIATRLPSPDSLFWLIWLLATSAICGTLAAATRRWIQRHRD